MEVGERKGGLRRVSTLGSARAQLCVHGALCGERPGAAAATQSHRDNALFFKRAQLSWEIDRRRVHK